MTQTTTEPTAAEQLHHALPAIVVHVAFRREFRLAPPLVRAVTPGDRARAAVVADHLRFLVGGLHHHHHLEDEMVWPPLRARAGDACQPLVELMEAQHLQLVALLDRIEALVPVWSADPDTDRREELATTLDDLHAALVEHLDIEERQVFPLAERHLRAEEWEAIGRRAEEGNQGPERALVFGMLAYEGDPEVVASMLATAPLPVRLLVPRLARRAYRRHATAVHGTPTP